MATTKISIVDGKINELTSLIKVMTSRETENKLDPTYIAKSTKQTQLYHMKRERRVLALIKNLIAANPDVKLSPEDQETFVLITTLSDERKSTKYVFNEGDDLYDIYRKYENLSRKDLDKKLEKLGLKADFAAGKVVKA
jgi:hypothetical protein